QEDLDLGQHREKASVLSSLSMGQDFELAERKGEEHDLSRKTSYVSLTRKHSSVQEAISSSNLALRTNASYSNRVPQDSSVSKDDRLSDGETIDADDYQKTPRNRERLKSPPDSDAIGAKLKEELCKYKQELKEYNETTKDLEEKYMKINYELSEMAQKHDNFVANRSSQMDIESEADLDCYYNSASSVASQLTVKRKSPHIMRSNTSFITVLSGQSSCDEIGRKKYPPSFSHSNGRRNPHSKDQRTKLNLSSQVFDSRIVETLANRHARRRKRSEDDLENLDRDASSFKDVYHVLKDVMNTSQVRAKLNSNRDRDRDRDRSRDSGDLCHLLTTIKSLKSEQMQFRTIIRQQQDRIADYHTRCVKAQEIMCTQKHEIDKLHVNNKQLESSIYHDIDSLRSKIDNKLKNVSHLPQMMREEHTKYEKVMRENCLLADKLHALQQEALQLKVKIDDLGRRKLVTINRLKAAERDLKIFKNYNAALKTEKRRLTEELSSMKSQLEQLQVNSKRQLSRHREQSEKQRRDLQKKIFDLELKLSRSQNSTSSLIQERDSLIAELQTQLHTLVHNFEVSQKHIRVLRRHIYSMTNNGSAGINSGCGSAGIGGGVGIGGGGGSSQRASEAGLIRINPFSQGSSTGRIGSPRTLKSKI
ncbi:hypothetical protein KR018_006200, partial [Drosophila ironensis]